MRQKVVSPRNKVCRRCQQGIRNRTPRAWSSATKKKKKRRALLIGQVAVRSCSSQLGEFRPAGEGGGEDATLLGVENARLLAGSSSRLLRRDGDCSARTAGLGRYGPPMSGPSCSSAEPAQEPAAPIVPRYRFGGQVLQRKHEGATCGRGVVGLNNAVRHQATVGGWAERAAERTRNCPLLRA